MFFLLSKLTLSIDKKGILCMSFLFIKQVIIINNIDYNNEIINILNNIYYGTNILISCFNQPLSLFSNSYKNINAPESSNSNDFEYSKNEIVLLQFQVKSMITDNTSPEEHLQIEKISNLKRQQENVENLNTIVIENYNKQAENLRSQFYQAQVLQNDINLSAENTDLSRLNNIYSTLNNIIDSPEKNMIDNIINYILNNDDNKEQLEDNNSYKQLKDNPILKRVFSNTIDSSIGHIENTVINSIDKEFILNVIQKQNLFDNVIEQYKFSHSTNSDFAKNHIDYLEHLYLSGINNAEKQLSNLNKLPKQLAIDSKKLTNSGDVLKPTLTSNIKTLSQKTEIDYKQMNDYKLNEEKHKNFNSALTENFINAQILKENLNNTILGSFDVSNTKNKLKNIEIKHKNSSSLLTECFINTQIIIEDLNNNISDFFDTSYTQNELKSAKIKHKNFAPVLAENFINAILFTKDLNDNISDFFNTSNTQNRLKVVETKYEKINSATTRYSINTEMLTENLNSNPVTYQETKSKFIDAVNGFYNLDKKIGIEKLNYNLYIDNGLKNDLFNKNNYIQQNFENEINDIFKSKNNDNNKLKIIDTINLNNNSLKYSKENSDFFPRNILNTNNAGNVGDVSGNINVSNEDILYMRDIAGTEAVNKYNQKLVSPIVNITFTGDIRETADIDVINEAIKNNIISELNSGAENNHF